MVGINEREVGDVGLGSPTPSAWECNAKQIIILYISPNSFCTTLKGKKLQSDDNRVGCVFKTILHNLNICTNLAGCIDNE